MPLNLYMISKVSALYLLCLTMLCALFALSYNLIIIEDHNGITKVLATSSDDSGDSGNSDDSGDSGNSDDSGDSGNSDDSESLSPIQQPSTAGDLARPIPHTTTAPTGPLVDAPSYRQFGPDTLAGAPSPPGTGPDTLAGAPSPPGTGPGPLAGHLSPSHTLRDDRFRLNSEDIAMEIAYLTPFQIRNYPITDLSVADQWVVLNFLAPTDLAKVLKNIPTQDLFVVKQGIGEYGFNVLLSKLATSDILFIKARLN